jgi:ribosomal-protein-alanine N-acetyltransferase
MKLDLETPRLQLRVLNLTDAPKTLEFYKNNAHIFEKYEPIIGENFYTLEHQEHLLSYEYEQILHLHMMRFWIFEKTNPDRIIGTVSFHNITTNIFSSTQVGYKMDVRYWRRGYCYEALTAGIQLISQEIGIRRFEALVLPDNTPSIRLLEKVGFQREGLLKEKILLQHKWRDHYVYAMIIK